MAQVAIGNQQNSAEQHSPICNMFMMQHGFVIIPMVTALLESSRFVELFKAKPRMEAWEARVVASECGFNFGYFKVSE